MWLSRLSALLLLVGALCAAQAQVPQTGAGLGTPFIPSCSPSSTFIGRTSGLSTGTKVALDGLLCGMVTDGLLTNVASGYCTTTFDLLYIFAVDDSTDALLNVCSSSFTATNHSAPFSALNGFTGTDASTTIYIDPSWNPVTNGVNYALNSAHITAWSATTNLSSASGGIAVGNYDGVHISTLLMYYNNLGPNSYVGRINEVCCTGVVNATAAIGMGAAVRTGALAANELIYLNGTNLGQTGSAGTSIPNAGFFILAQNDNGTNDFGFGNRVSEVSLGSALTPTQVTNFCHRMNTYLHTINGTASGIC